MKKPPKKTKHWAKEAYEALEKAILLFEADYPESSEDERLALVTYSISIAALNRNIQEDSEKVKKALDYVLANLAAHMENKEQGESINIALCFLIGYLDAHVSFGMLKEAKLQEIMIYLSENFDVHK